MQNTKAVLFDVDGTLLDTREFILSATEYSLQKYGYQSPSRKILSSHVGKPLVNFYQSIAKLDDVSFLCQTHHEYQMQNLHLINSFPNTVETLEKLKTSKIKMAAVTSRTNKNSILTLEMSGLLRFLDFVISAEDVINMKPHPEPLFKAMQLLDVTPEQTYMIGDAEADILAGKNAGTKTVGVTYGFGGHAIAEHKPDYLVHDIQEIITIIKSL